MNILTKIKNMIFGVKPSTDILPFMNADITFDPKTNVITVYGDYHINFAGNLTVTSNEDIVIASGKYNGRETGDIYLNSTGEFIHSSNRLEIEDSNDHNHDCGC